ncbi:MAG: magnesium chelatase, partial [Tateyamaria sp.]|nr:magnesium chelatase [Tateyamaria sp.]
QLRPLLNQLSKHKGDAYFIVGDRDRTVLPHVSEDAAEIIPNAKVHYILGSGHLAHEEQPIDVASIIHSIIAKQPI